MPEGVEVLKQTDFISLLFEGNMKEYSLVELEATSKRLKFEEEILGKIIGQNLEAIFCKGKYFFIVFKTFGILAHHGMSGCWSVEKLPNTHARLLFESPSGHRVELFWINERFGDFKLMKNYEEVEKFYISLADGFIGIDILSEEDWMKKIAGFSSRKKIRETFFDQHQLCSGIGNYLIAEIFYKARLHPNALFSKLSEEQLRSLYHICKKTVEGFYNGELSKIIYKREKDPQGRTITSETIGARTMHWVPEIQKLGI